MIAAATVKTWVIPHDALTASYSEMASDGRNDREGIALWAGHRDDLAAEIRVTRVVLLRGRGITRARGFIRIRPELINEVTDLLSDRGDENYLVGQIHGHPPCSSTDLSPTDIEFGIRSPAYLSVVAPAYGMLGVNMRSCGLHVFVPERGWQRLAVDEVGTRIRVAESGLLEVCEVGGRNQT